MHTADNIKRVSSKRDIKHVVKQWNVTAHDKNFTRTLQSVKLTQNGEDFLQFVRILNLSKQLTVNCITFSVTF
jgi:hypothetical protein